MGNTGCTTGETLTFNSKTHTYRVNGRKLTSVTQAIKDNFGEPPWYNDYNAAKGIALHQAIHFYNMGTLDQRTLNKEIRGKFEAYKLFRAQTRFQVIDSEIQLYSKKYNFAGTIDIAGEPWDSSNLTIIDIKSSIEPKVEIQLGGYSILYSEHRGRVVNRAAALELKNDGSYNIKWFKDLKRARRIFLATLTISNWMNEQ